MPLIKLFQEHRYKVELFAGQDNFLSQLLPLGVKFLKMPIKPGSRNIFREAVTFISFFFYLKKKYHLAIHFTIKPVIYGGLACRFFRIPYFCVIPGIGSMIMRKNFSQKILVILYKFALANAKKVMFLNQDNIDLFLKYKIVSPAQAVLLPGEGVDIQHFYYVKPQITTRKFLFMGRILADKGINEFVMAAKNIRLQNPEIEFFVLGPLGEENPSAIEKNLFERWVKEGIITYLGTKNDVRNIIAAMHCVVLPSHSIEGLPRVLLEAAAMGRVIIASDTPGCKDVVTPENGFLCQAKDVDSLVSAMNSFLELSDEAMEVMGKAGRELVKKKFTEEKVIEKYKEVLSKFL